MTNHAAFVALCLASTSVFYSCGGKGSSKSVQTPNTLDEYADTSGFLVFSPAPGSYEAPLEIVVRPRAVATNKTMEFEILNAKTTDCPDEGPKAKCITLTKSKKVEYVVRLYTTGRDGMEQLPGAVEYTITGERPQNVPPPNEPATEVLLEATKLEAFRTTCYQGSSSQSVKVALTNADLLGEGKAIWLHLSIYIEGANGNEIVITDPSSAYITAKVGTGDSSSTTSVASLGSGACKVTLHDKRATKGSAVCTFIKTRSTSVDSSFLKNESVNFEIKNWRCPK